MEWGGSIYVIYIYIYVYIYVTYKYIYINIYIYIYIRQHYIHSSRRATAADWMPDAPRHMSILRFTFERFDLSFLQPVCT